MSYNFSSRFAALLILSSSLAAPSFAAGGGKKAKTKKPSNHYEAEWEIDSGEEEDIEIDVKKVGQAIDLPLVIIPVEEYEGLANYAFVSIRITLDEHVDAWSIRANGHFLKDAIIRYGHENVLQYAEDRENIDPKMLETMIVSAIQPWVVETQIESIKFLKLDLQQ